MSVKPRLDIHGSDPSRDRALHKALEMAATSPLSQISLSLGCRVGSAHQMSHSIGGHSPPYGFLAEPNLIEGACRNARHERTGYIADYRLADAQIFSCTTSARFQRILPSAQHH